MSVDPLTLFLFFAVALVVWLWRWEHSSFVRRIDRIPGPPRASFFGNFFNIPRDGPGLLQTFNVKWPKVYGTVYRFWRGMFPIVNISSAQDVELILSSQKHINKSITGAFLLPWLGDGLLLSAGNKWRKDRKLLTPAFHFQILDGFFDVFNRNANIFVDLINKKRSEQKEVDIYPMASRCTLDIICEAAMGIQINAQVTSDSKYITAIGKVEEFITGRINSVLGLLPDWFYFRFTSHGRELQTYLDIVHGFTKKVLLARKAQVDHQRTAEGTDEDNQFGTKKRRAFLDLLLEAARQGADLSETDIVSQVDTFMFEGHDTTSAAITWFLYCMVTHPQEQDRVYDEIKDVFGDSDRPCTLEDMSNCKYLDCCIKESLRLYPPVSFIRRRMNEDVRFSGHDVPVGTSVGILIYSLHRNEEFFPDPNSFKPERFQSDTTTGRNPFAFVPFSAGPRNCIGQKFATYEDKVILTTLLRNFRFDIDSRRVPIQESLNMILKPEGGMPLLVTPRR